MAIRRRVPLPLIFLAVWLPGLVFLGATFFRPFGAILSIPWAGVCYVFAFLVFRILYPQNQTSSKDSLTGAQISTQRSLRHTSFYLLRACLLVALIFMISPILVWTYAWVAWDPIGTAHDIGVGPPPCLVRHIAAVPSSRGAVASVRSAYCPGLYAGADWVTFFVFVRYPPEAEGHGNLVFRYDPTGKGSDDPPRVSWTTPSKLRITVADGDLWQVTKQRFEIRGAIIEYVLPKAEDIPELEFWQRPFLCFC